jgi:hypothetical protein
MTTRPTTHTAGHARRAGTAGAGVRRRETRVMWPDTTHTDPPGDHPYASAVWLLGRHRLLTFLLLRVPGVITTDSHGEHDLDLDALAQAVADYDDHTTAWAAYTRRRIAPSGEDAYDAWVAAGPTPTPGATALAAMSRTERTRVRLLAAFASTRTRLALHDLAGLDDAGQRLVEDWCVALLAY